MIVELRLGPTSISCQCAEYAIFLSKFQAAQNLFSAVGLGFPGGSDGKESACDAGDPGSIPGFGRSPGDRNGLPTLVFLPGESHGEKSLAGYSPSGRKESDTTE